MPLTKVLIAVKTYPTISTKYDELVCTAGFLEDGTWIRVYPIQFRLKPYSEWYKKYEWIEIDLVKNSRDFRPESYRPYSIDSEIKIIGSVNTDNNWEERKKICLRNVYTDLSQLISDAKTKGTSLAVFKPTTIKEFIVEEEKEREWNSKKLAALKQYSLFSTNKNDGEFEVVRKLPYKFSYKFTDIEGRESTLMIEDWEIGQLYWNSLSRHEGDEAKAVIDVKNKFYNELALTKDLYFFLGTTHQFHKIAPNPFIIIGAFYPKKEDPRIGKQTTLF